MKDKLALTKQVLGNGMTLYYQQDRSVDFAISNLIAPVGTAHNHGDIIPGSFHYLEHLIMKKCELFPDSSAMGKARELGGSFGAYTWFGITYYPMMMATSHISEMMDAQLSHFFHPTFTQEDVIKERGIIASERKRESPFYPADKKKDWYRKTTWKQDCLYPVEQIFGSDEDFEKMNAEYFHALHKKYYHHQRVQCVIIGNFDLDEVCKKLESIPLRNHNPLPDLRFNPLRWVSKDFHEFPSDETSRFEYHYEWIYQVNQNEESFHSILNQIAGKMLLDYSNGPLMQWLRHEKGWLYEIRGYLASRQGTISRGFMIPLDSMDKVITVRAELSQRIHDALTNNVLLEKFKQQTKNSSVFWYQKMNERMDAIIHDINWGKHPESLNEYLTIVDSLTTEILAKVFEEQMRPNIGELLIVPER